MGGSPGHSFDSSLLASSLCSCRPTPGVHVSHNRVHTHTQTHMQPYAGCTRRAGTPLKENKVASHIGSQSHNDAASDRKCGSFRRATSSNTVADVCCVKRACGSTRLGSQCTNCALTEVTCDTLLLEHKGVLAGGVDLARAVGGITAAIVLGLTSKVLQGKREGGEGGEGGMQGRQGGRQKGQQ